MTDLYVAMAAAALVVLFTEAQVTESCRTWLYNNQHAIGKVLDCQFCTSWWVCGVLGILTGGINFWQIIRIPALVTGCMCGIMVINWAMSTYSVEE